MSANKHYFTVNLLGRGNNDRSYTVEGNEVTTLDGVWASQKCWFSKGQHIVITDECGNAKRFIKE